VLIIGGDGQLNSINYSVLKMMGKPGCILNRPVKTVRAISNIQCGSSCATINCQLFNYVDNIAANRDANCQLFNGWTSLIGIVEGCTSYQVS
jgi:hypothetical protein